MPEFYLIKNFITLNFGGNNKNTVVIGEKNEGVIGLSSQVEAKSVNLPRNSTNRQPKQLKAHHKS